MNLIVVGILGLLIAGTASAVPTAGCTGSCTGSCTGQAKPHLIPADKDLSPAWIRSLYERGKPEVFTDAELKYIGMPIGGIGCGQLYLGGDGRLWLWDIFKSNYRREPDHGQRIAAFTLGGHYAHPVAYGEQYTKWNGAQVAQGFLIRTRADGRIATRTLDKQGFSKVGFRGEYPVGKVTYQDQGLPVTVALEAFSPFIPLNAKDSALPATVMSYTVVNTSDEAIVVDLGGWMQNATCPYTTDPSLGRRVNRVVQDKERVSVLSTIESAPGKVDSQLRPDIVLADFESEDWDGWDAEGEAFAGGPFPSSQFVAHQKVSGFSGKKLANSFNTRIAPKSGETDRLTGTLTSPAFTIERNFIMLSVCGGENADQVYVEAVVDGESIGKVTGHDSIAMRKKNIDVSKYQGNTATLRIVDSARGGWGHITADQIVLTDSDSVKIGIEDRHGYGSSTLTLLHGVDDVTVTAATVLDDPESPEGLFGQMGSDATAVGKPLDELLVGGLTASFTLAPGKAKTIDFLITWYFPHHNEIDAAPGQILRTKDFRKLGRHYKPWFKSAGEVAGYIAANKGRLLGETRQWNRTWYDSTLPYWFLDRSFIAIDCVASQMFHWFDNGRPYGWEGVDCCPGTCTHVWHYAQGLARIFPELERAFREKVDFKAGVGFHPDTGLISDRGDYHAHEATDGQAGTILRVYREHLTSKDDTFLRGLWPNIKKSIQFLMAKDPEGRGLLAGKQPHTLDAAWFGPMGWVSGLYLGALTAGEAMAEEMGDTDFAYQCRTLIDRGKKSMVAELFNGEYFIHKPDPDHNKALQTGKGCHIDQVLGQAWMFQVGLGRVFPKQETVSALNSLWKYNFAPDAGGYAMKQREIEKAFRWYAMPGEAGLLMCTWPKGGAKEAIPGDALRPEKNPEVWTGPGGYFNECMNGFEYQVAWHMIAEGEPGSTLVQQGLAIIKAIHERYGPSKRNPYNEIECGDHYARSMASYGIFLTACGFDYHGPKGRLGFAPKLSPEKFKAPFTTAEGWGSFSQHLDGKTFTATVDLKWGRLQVNSLRLTLPKPMGQQSNLHITVNGNDVRTFTLRGKAIDITFENQLQLQKGDQVVVVVAAG